MPAWHTAGGAPEAHELDLMVNRWGDGWRGTRGFMILFKLLHKKKKCRRTVTHVHMQIISIKFQIQKKAPTAAVLLSLSYSQGHPLRCISWILASPGGGSRGFFCSGVVVHVQQHHPATFPSTDSKRNFTSLTPFYLLLQHLAKFESLSVFSKTSVTKIHQNVSTAHAFCVIQDSQAVLSFSCLIRNSSELLL